MQWGKLSNCEDWAVSLSVEKTTDISIYINKVQKSTYDYSCGTTSITAYLPL